MRDTTDLFLQAFSKPNEKPLPQSRKEAGWRVTKRVGHGMSFADLFDLQALQDEGARWDDHRLQYYKENNLITLSSEAQREDKRLTEQTGFNSRERAEIFNAAQIDAEILQDLLKNPEMSMVLEGELQRFMAKYGEEGLEMVKQDPEAAAELHRRSRQAEIQAQAQKAAVDGDVAQELRDAAKAIEEMNQSRSVGEMSADELKAELLKRDAMARSESGDE